MREESEEQHDADQNNDSSMRESGEIGQTGPAVRERPHEYPAVGAEHVDGGDHDTPDGADGCNLVTVEAKDLFAVEEAHLWFA